MAGGVKSRFNSIGSIDYPIRQALTKSNLRHTSLCLTHSMNRMYPLPLPKYMVFFNPRMYVA